MAIIISSIGKMAIGAKRAAKVGKAISVAKGLRPIAPKSIKMIKPPRVVKPNKKIVATGKNVRTNAVSGRRKFYSRVKSYKQKWETFNNLRERIKGGDKRKLLYPSDFKKIKKIMGRMFAQQENIKSSDEKNEDFDS